MELTKKEKLVRAGYIGIEAARRIYASCLSDFPTSKYLGLVGSADSNPNKMLTEAEDMLHRMHCEDVLLGLNLTDEDTIRLLFVQEQMDRVYQRRHILSEFCARQDLRLVRGLSIMIDKELGKYAED